MIGRKRSICIGASTRSSPGRDRPATMARNVAIGTPIAEAFHHAPERDPHRAAQRAVLGECTAGLPDVDRTGESLVAKPARAACELPQREQHDDPGEALDAARHDGRVRRRARSARFAPSSMSGIARAAAGASVSGVMLTSPVLRSSWSTRSIGRPRRARCSGCRTRTSRRSSAGSRLRRGRGRRGAADRGRCRPAGART